MSHARALWDLARPGNAALAAVGTLVGALGAAGWDASTAPVVLAMAAAAIGVIGGNAVNDARDVRIDRSAHPERPVAGGRLSSADAGWFGANMLVLALAVAAAANFWVVLLAASLAANLLLYEYFAKGRGVFGHFLVSYNTGALFVLGGVAALAPAFTYAPLDLARIAMDPRLARPLAMAILALLLNFARELYKSAEDAPHDAPHRRTFAVRHGPAAAKRLGDGIAWATVPLALIPAVLRIFDGWYLVLVTPLLLLLLAVPFVDAPRRQRMWLKVGMVLGMPPFLLPALL